MGFVKILQNWLIGLTVWPLEGVKFYHFLFHFFDASSRILEVLLIFLVN